MADQPTEDSGTFDPSLLVERAIESVLDQVPDLPDFAVPESELRIQPWADVAAPPGKNKRPLEELLAEYAERVAAAPDARAGAPADKPAAAAYLDRFSRTAAPAPGTGRSKRRRRRGKGGDGIVGPVGTVGPRPAHPQGGGNRRPGGGRPQTTPQPPSAGRPPGAPGSGKRRRRGRGRGPRSDGGNPPAPTGA